MYTHSMKPIPGLEGLYSATEDGQIYSHPRKLHSDIPSFGDYTRKGRFLKQMNGGGGRSRDYRTVTIRPVAGSKLRYRKRVHRLVALAWIPNPENLPQINHIDGNKSNNHIPNLEWCTAQHNSQHAWDTGLNELTPPRLEWLKRGWKHRNA